MNDILETVKETVTDKNFLIGLASATSIFSAVHYLQGRRHRNNLQALTEQMKKELSSAPATE